MRSILVGGELIFVVAASCSIYASRIARSGVPYDRFGTGRD